MQKKGREVASCLFHNLSPFICTCSRCRFFMLEVAAKTASRYFFPKIARYRFAFEDWECMNCAFILSKHFLIVKLPQGMFFEKQTKFFAYEGSPLSVVYYDVNQQETRL